MNHVPFQLPLTFFEQLPPSREATVDKQDRQGPQRKAIPGTWKLKRGTPTKGRLLSNLSKCFQKK